jgi:bifunctional UDP-N-acetylglucosamine pyrophosphorylase/glucosamine-1-phosphate N-acetyltransferase
MSADPVVASPKHGDRPLAVLVLAAGLGTRMRSATAKVLHRLGDRPLIAYVLDAARKLSPDRLIVIVGHQAEEVEAACKSHGDCRRICFVRQAEQRGTGHAVRCATPGLAGFGGDVLIIYGDVPTLRAETLASFVEGHARSGAALSLLTACFRDPTGYGRIIRGASGEIERIVEERDATPDEEQIQEINAGIYCVAAELLFETVGSIATDNAQGEYYLTDVVSVARRQGRRLWSCGIEDPEEVRGINTRAELAGMEASMRKSIVEKWMAAGVTFEDPQTAYVGADVKIGRDTTIGPNTHLRGATVIGEGCRIDGSAYIQGARLGARVHLKFAVVITDSNIGDDVEMGPFAHLRPGTDLARGVHIGNFVEAKKAKLGPGTKANHLSYLGDVTVGEKTNIGAGTITCNYDGFRKHPTVIGDRVQIGSDTQLVAPVEVGSDAYVGAGTTVTHAVPPGALAVSRTPQRNIEGWVARRRARESGDAAAKAATDASGKPPRSTTKTRARQRLRVVGRSRRRRLVGGPAQEPASKVAPRRKRAQHGVTRVRVARPASSRRRTRR